MNLRGEQHPRSLLSSDDVRAIRLSNESGIALADRYGVSSDTIYALRRRKTWAWLD